MRNPIAVLLLVVAFFPSALGALLAVDYGAEWTKASLVGPGIPFDVLLDKDSKRKMQSVVGYKRDERVFGGEAVNAATRFPKTHFPYVKPLLALTTPPPSNISSIYPVQPHLHMDTQTLYFPHLSPPSHLLNPGENGELGTTWLPEEILAHELNYIKALASSAISEPVTDLFLTLPAYLTQHQKRAFRDAAEVAGLNLVGAVSEGAAVGLNYAMTRQFPKISNDTSKSLKERGAQIDIIYDSGAMKTTATVLAFYTADVFEESPASITKSGKKSKLRPKAHPTTFVEVVASASEPSLGGVQIDQDLREILVKDVAEKLGMSVADVKSDDRAMRKLWREAGRAKGILSANQEASVNIESLINDEDYRSRISRTQLEDASTSFSGKFTGPIDNALRKAGLAISDINSLILFGGNTRVPLVQAAVKSALKGNEDKIAQNVNTDEAAVLGAAFYGASQGRSVKSKIRLKVVEGLGWNVDYVLDKASGWKVVDQEKGDFLFPAGTAHSTKKVLTFAKDLKSGSSDSLSLNLNYVDSNAPSPSQLLNVDVKGIDKAMTNLTETEMAASQIKLTMRIDSRGFVQTANAVLHIPLEPKEKESVKDKLKGLFGSGKEEKETEELLKNLEADLDELDKGEREKKVALKFTETHLGIKPLSAEVKKQAKARLAAINNVEAEISARAEARNLLEGYLYRLTGLLGDDPSSDALQKFSTAEEQKFLSTGAQAAFEWMAEEADTADLKTLKGKRSHLEDAEMIIIKRYQEAIARPKAVDDFQKAMSGARMFFIEAKKNQTEAIAKDEPLRHSEEELNDIFERLQENEAWMSDKMKQYKVIEHDLTKDPVFFVKDLNEKGKNLQMAVIRLQNKRIPKAKPKTTSTSATTESATASESATTTSDAEPTVTTTVAADEPQPEVPPHEEL